MESVNCLPYLCSATSPFTSSITAASLLRYRLERSCQTSDCPFHPAGKLSSASTSVLTPQVPTISSWRMGFPGCSLPSPHSWTWNQPSVGRGLAMLPSKGSRQHQASLHLPLLLHQLGAGPHPPAQGKPLCSHWCEPNTNWHRSYNSLSLEQQSLEIQTARNHTGEVGDRRGPVKALYPHWCNQQNWLQASSGREMQKHFKTKLNYLGNKMGDARKACLHGPCTALCALY